jgi:hypothetical protein
MLNSKEGRALGITAEFTIFALKTHYNVPRTSAIGPDLLKLRIYCGAITEFRAYPSVPSHFLNVVVSKSISTIVQFSVPTKTRSPTS